ncbi:zinc-dependent metalloprotease [Aquabacterium sp.]|uniref:zinc-dependent metalloprotease n=1 Tax=Aquabacterium sp. TaxID=1872578 RepID=UPI003D6CD6B2
MTVLRLRPTWFAARIAMVLALPLSGCSTLQNGPIQWIGWAASTAPPPTAATPAPTPAPGQAPAFDTVVKGAERMDGLLPLWKRQDKVWIELSPANLNRAFFLSPTVVTGIGEAGLFGGLMTSRSAQVGRPQWVEFRRVQQQVQLLAMNAAYTAQKGTPQELAVQAAFSPSLLASVSVASAPQAQTGAILIEANPLWVNDMLGLGLQLQRAYRQSYSLDSRNSALSVARAQSDQLTFDILHHFATSSIASGGSGGQSPGVPTSVPDPRSLFINVRYSLRALPATAMKSRAADPRVGYFTTTVADFTQDLARTPRQRFISRWRLEKKDPAAALSEPVRPIIYQLEPSIPVAYRPTIIEGILAWNKAFEAIGIKDAIQVRAPSPTAASDESFNQARATVRWMTNSQPGFGAIGPTHVDPRTGEILQADIALESLSSRSIRTFRSEIMAMPTAHSPDEACDHAAQAAEQLGYGLELLESAPQGLDPDSPDVQAFVLAYLKDTTMHEVGHTLGLRHNFRGSRWHTAEQLASPALTLREGNSASVMDYAPINLPLPGRPAPAAFQTTLGPYDYWAIEYGYKAIDGPEAPALRQIAERSADPAWADKLDFGTDEDDYLGLDPQSLTFDLGRDPVVFARQRLTIAKDLIARQAHDKVGPQDDPALLRRRVTYALRDVGRTSQVLMRQVGGLVTRRDAPGSGRDPLDPLPAATQRAALDLLAQTLLSPQALSLSPSLQRRMVPDYFERIEGYGARTDFSVADTLLTLQRAVLDTLMTDSLAERLLDNIDKTRDRHDAPLTVQELHQRLKDAVWGLGVKPPKGDDAPWRRNLQREYVNHLSALVVRSSSDRADVRSVVREQARSLLSTLRANPWGSSPADTSEAHRQDCIETLARALDASVVRTSP